MLVLIFVVEGLVVVAPEVCRVQPRCNQLRVRHVVRLLVVLVVVPFGGTPLVLPVDTRTVVVAVIMAVGTTSILRLPQSRWRLVVFAVSAVHRRFGPRPAAVGSHHKRLRVGVNPLILGRRRHIRRSRWMRFAVTFVVHPIGHPVACRVNMHPVAHTVGGRGVFERLWLLGESAFVAGRYRVGAFIRTVLVRVDRGQRVRDRMRRSGVRCTDWLCIHRRSLDLGQLAIAGITSSFLVFLSLTNTDWGYSVHREREATEEWRRVRAYILLSIQ